MNKAIGNYWIYLIVMLLSACEGINTEFKREGVKKEMTVTAKDILGNPDYQAISYGGYRGKSRELQPTPQQLDDDMKILSAMGIKIIRTYNVKLAQAENILKAIRRQKKKNPQFEMYVMLGAWIDCKNAWSDLPPDHNTESFEENEVEINRAVELAKEYSDIIKIIAVGNEAMVKWATSYYVQADVILKWVNHLQMLKKEGVLPSELWITSSDNFASWGGGDAEYHTEDLKNLIKAVDYVSLHTYPMHDTHYNPDFWGNTRAEQNLNFKSQIRKAMERAVAYAQSQYIKTSKYIHSISPGKPVHIGETGWASASNSFYGSEGSGATDEFKAGIYYQLMREWTDTAQISCFYFEAFDEPWKDHKNPGGSENHFGLFTVNGQAKYALWKKVDEGVFIGLSRDGHSIGKTYDGKTDSLMATVSLPPVKEGLVNRYSIMEVDKKY